jgi:hypothetical protein
VEPVQGDRVEIVVDVGGTVRQYEVTATRAGRRVEVSTARGVVEVSEVTRSGQPVRSARFMWRPASSPWSSTRLPRSARGPGGTGRPNPGSTSAPPTGDGRGAGAGTVSVPAPTG